jgi:tryptophan synthase alpha chain
MSRIKDLFTKKKSSILNVYCTAGYPQLHSTIEVMKALQQYGADIIELGMPYSDPLADGPVIQQSSNIALKNGMTIGKLFDQLNNFRSQVSVPVILMGYMNPVLQYGFEKFCAAASAAGIDGLILPDLPEYEFESTYGPIIKQCGLDFIFLITPETHDDRIKKLDMLSSGFLYAVSSSSTTGTEKKSDGLESYLYKLKSLHLQNPILVGFGIHDKKSFQSVCELADGAIIGSAFIKSLESNDNVNAATKSFLSSILS